MKYFEFLPKLVLKIKEKPPYAFYKKGAVLFSDVSGFTPMSEKLSILGAEGAEVLTDILNKYFSKMIGIIKENGGEVMKFGGDAIHCFFPFEESLPYAIKASFEMQEEMRNYKKIKTPVGNFSLSMKIGLAYGDVLIGSFGDPNKRLEYIFAGEPVDRSAEAEHYAKAGEIVLYYEERDIEIEKEKIDENIYKLVSFKKRLSPLKSKEEKIKSLYEKAYLLPEVYEAFSRGYTKQLNSLLEVLSIFFQFTGFSYREGEFDEKKFQEFFLKIIEVAEKYDGRINRLSMGDKGSTALFLFGAPNQIEKKEEVGCQFALDLKENLKKYFPEINFKTGMNSGKAFAGIVGGSGRMEYTIMGDSVNFSARLMQAAGEEEILASSNIYEKAKDTFEFKYLGEKYFKGKEEPQRVYLVEKRKEKEFYEFKEIKISGREKELKEINKLLKDAENGKPNMIILEGEGGIGKTHLANFIINKKIKEGWRIYQTKGEITLKNHIYAPFKELLKRVFFKGEIKKEEIEKIIKETDESFVEYLPIHLEFFGLKEKKIEMEEETKKKLMHHQLSVILLKKIKDEPTIIFLDNLHWFDTLSKELLLSILHHLQKEKLLILVCTREREEKFKDLPVCSFIEIKGLGQKEIKEILEEEEKEKIREDLINFINEKSRGNPFFSINFFKYLKDNNLIEKRLGEWVLKRGAEIKKDFTFSDIISARIANLSIEEKVHLRISACMGPTFKKEILKNVLKKDYKEEVFNKLIKDGFFSEVDENTYSFNQTLMQETIYQEIPEMLKKINHRAIGKEMEKLFKENKDFYPNLANHFYIAGIKDKAGYYSIKAGDLLFEKYAYPEAKIFYERVFNLYKKYKGEIKFKAGQKYSKTLLRAGKPKEALIILEKIIKNAKKRKLKELVNDFQILKFECFKRLGRYNFIKMGEEILKKIENKELANHLKCLIAECYFRKMEFERAIQLFENVLSEKNFSLKEDITSAYTFLLNIYAFQRKYEKAFKNYQDGITFCKENNDFYQLIRLRIAYAGALFETGKIDEAIEEMKNLISLAENLGDFYYLSSIYLNCGRYMINKKHYKDSLFYLGEAAKILEKLGSIEGMGYAISAEGMVFFYMKKFFEAYKRYLKANEYFSKAGEKMASISNMYNLSEVCLILNKKNKALEWYYKGISSFKKENDPELYKMFEDLKKKIDNM
ncbi:MAG: adenylate/guanylate cyclase domain-containing protein [candidate division WOR-3 bacterium]